MLTPAHVIDHQRNLQSILRISLSLARREAAAARAHRCNSESVTFARGLYTGQVLAAALWFHADHERAQAVANEIRFLLGRYLDEARR